MLIHQQKIFIITIAELRLTAFVAFLGVAVTGLDRGALTVAVDAVTGASTLLDAPTTSHRTMGPFRPGGPTILCIVTCYRGGGRNKGSDFLPWEKDSEKEN